MSNQNKPNPSNQNNDEVLAAWHDPSESRTPEEIDALLALTGRLILKRAKDGVWWAFFGVGAAPHHGRCIGQGTTEARAKADLYDHVCMAGAIFEV